MKKTFFAILLFSINGKAFTQNVKECLLNRYFEVTTNEKDAYFFRLAKPYKGVWAYTDYDGKGKAVQLGYFTDSNFRKKTGPYSFYWEGKLLYKGRYEDGAPAGYWYFYDKKGNLHDSLHYATKEEQKKKTIVDTVDADELSKTQLLLQEHIKKDTSALFSKVDVEASFNGGEKAWSKYVKKQLSFPDLVMTLNRPKTYTSEVQFIVCTDGEICSVEAIKSSHPLLDMMAVNAIRKGPKWMPASQDGKNVKAWRRQKISFSFAE